VRSGTVVRVTDGSGIAVLGLPAGARTIVVALVGFVPDTLAIVVGPDTTLTVQLVERVAELEAVAVTATRGERRLEDEPERVEVLAGEDVAEKTEMRPADITMLLSEMVGVRTQVTSPSLGGAVVRIQGLRGHYTQFLTDGLPLRGAAAGGLSLLQIPPLDLRQVEVIKGAASALYGPSALGGVVNLVSRRPGDERELVLSQSSRGGSDGFAWLSRRASEHWGFTVIGDAHHQSEKDVSGDGWADFPGFTRVQARPRVFWTGGDSSEVMATLSAMGEDRTGGTVSGALAPDGESFPERLETRRGDVGVAGRVRLGAGPVLALRLAGAEQRLQRHFGATVAADRYRLAFVEASVAGKRSSFDWLAGASSEWTAFDADSAPGLSYTFRVPAAFAQATIALDPHVTATASARCDAHNRYGTVCSPRVSALLKPGDAWSLRLSGGTGFFAPTPFTEETEGIDLTLLRPLTALRAERARTGSADLTMTLSGWEVSLTTYGSVITRPVALRGVAGAADGAVELINVTGATRAFGAEAFAVYDREPFVVTLHYSYVRATEVDPASGTRRDVPLNPRHNLFLDLAYEATARGTWIALEIDWTGRQALADDPYRATARSYVVAGLLASQRVGPVKLFLSGENLTGTRQSRYEPVLLPARGPGGRWTIPAWAPQRGRVVSAGVRLAM
jgi:iron complex outermembrane receptor protein